MCNRVHKAFFCSVCRLAVGGAVVPNIKAPALHKLEKIPAGEAVTWRSTYRIASFDRISLQAFLLLPAKCSVQPGVSKACLADHVWYQLACQGLTLYSHTLLCSVGTVSIAS